MSGHEKTQIIKGFRAATVHCPRHGNVYEWTAESDHFEAIKYDCGCLVTWDADLVGARPVLKSEGGEG